VIKHHHALDNMSRFACQLPASAGTGSAGGSGASGGDSDAVPLLSAAAGLVGSSSGGGFGGPASSRANTISSAPVIPTPTPRPKSKLANVSDFDHPVLRAVTPGAGGTTVGAGGVKQRLVGAAYTVWNTGLLCAGISSIIFALSGFCVKLTQGQ